MAVAQLLLGVVVVAIAAALLFEAAKLPPPRFDVLGSAAVPRALCILVIAMALPLVLQAAMHLWRAMARTQPATNAGEAAPPPRRPGLVVVTFVLVCVYVVVLQKGWMSFGIATTLFMIVLTGLLAAGRTRPLAIGIAVALVLGLGGDYIFTSVFLIDLP